MNLQSTGALFRRVLQLGIVCLAIGLGLTAQVQTEKAATQGQPTKQVTIERGEVVYVVGNDLVVKMEDGTIRHFPNVPESAKVDVDGQQLGIHDLKPGMKLQRTTVVTSTPRTVTTTQSVTGRVWSVSPPNSVILTLEDGKNQQFTIPKGQKFTVDGKETDAFGLRKGMTISATKVVEVPETVLSQQRTVTGTMPPPPEPPPADVPVLIVVTRLPAAPPAPAAEAAPKSAETAPAKLPATASLIPLFGLAGLISTGISFVLWRVRR